MAGPRKIINLPPITSLSANDLIVVEQVGSNSSTTSIMTSGNFKIAIFKGPYADDIEANTAGISIGQPYYTSSGDVKIRLT